MRRYNHIIPMEYEVNEPAMKAVPTYGGLPFFGEASGAIASFVTDIPYRLKKLTVDIDAVQDLHGYDAPWVGGAGKNLLDPSRYVQRSGYTNLSVSSSGNVITVTGYSAGGRFIAFNVPIEVGQDYTIKYTSRDGIQNSKYAEYDAEPTEWVNAGSDLNVNSAVTFTATKQWLQIWAELTNATSSTITNLQVEKGSSATDWTPFENICPISGWTGCEVYVTGKNLMNVDAISAIHSTAQNIRNGVVFEEVGTYTVSANHEVATGRIIYTRKYDKATDTYGSVTAIVGGSMFTYAIYTISDGDRLIVFDASETPISATKELFETAKVQVEFGSTATAYEPYNGHVYEITWQTEAGTVYGGTLDVTTGVLTIDRAIIGGSSWTQYNASNGYKAYRINDCVRGKYNADTPNEPMSNAISEFGSFSSSAMDKNIIQPPRSSSSVAYMALLESVDPSIVFLTYLIDTPQVVQLTAEEVKALCGQNNIFADCGDVDVEYFLVEQPSA